MIGEEIVSNARMQGETSSSDMLFTASLCFNPHKADTDLLISLRNTYLIGTVLSL